MEKLTCFKAYDIRGKIGDELNEDIAYRIGRSFAQHLNAKRVVVGADIRLTSNDFKAALANGLKDAGCHVLDIGLAGTEEIYFATPHLDADGGICVTASHNPIDFNGMKLVKRNSQPISGDSGLHDIKALAEANNFNDPVSIGKIETVNNSQPYIDCLLGYIDLAELKPMRIVVNPGNGAAGHVIDKLEEHFKSNQVPIEFIKIHHEPDGYFPNGIPNPLLPENRKPTADAVKENKADLGIAWDGDFDRCFLFDEKGQFIEGYYIVGLLAEAFLNKSKGEKIIHDPRVMWNTQEIVTENDGTPVLCKTGHAFIKERMRKEDAIYGGEMSAHHYFRDFWYCDSGMIPWLLVIELLSKKQVTLSSLVEDRIERFPSSGEINNQLKDPKAAIAAAEKHYGPEAISIDKTDGLSIAYPDWRFNLRCSNTEPVIRLNVETRQNKALLEEKTAELLSLIKRF
ncbi:MAG: phosphomannomutase [Pseudomonadales bacterium]|nr:phosphomannomutase [Pseudomonadales bacterium]